MKWHFSMMVPLVGIVAASMMPTRADEARGKAPVSVVLYANGYQDVTAAIQQVLEKAGIGPVQTTARPESLQTSALTGVHVVVLYCDNELPAQTIADLQAFVRAGGGLVALHHTAYSASFAPALAKLIGGSFAGAAQGGEKMGPYTVHIEDAVHPIAQGIKKFQVPHEERYILMAIDEGARLVFSSDGLAQKNLGWTRTEGQGRVFYFQPFHYLPTLETPELQRVLVHGVRWAAEEARPDKR